FEADGSERHRYIFVSDGHAGKADDLIERRFGVAHRAFTGARDGGKRRVADLHAETRGDLAKLIADLLERDGAKLKDLTARQNGFGNLLQFGRRHDEDDARRRLFQRLEPRVQGFGEDARRRRFADAARAGEQISMMQPPADERIAQRPRDGFLPDDFGETLRAELSGDDL